MRSCCLWMSKENGFLKWYLILMKMLEKLFLIKTKGLEHHASLVDKAVAGFERTDFNFGTSSTIGKILLNSLTCYREIVHKRRCSKPHCLALRNWHSHPILNNHYSDQSAAINKVSPSISKMMKTCRRPKW